MFCSYNMHNKKTCSYDEIISNINTTFKKYEQPNKNIN